MPGLMLADRLAATRDQLDALAAALGRVDVEAIETSARALADLVQDLPSAASIPRESSLGALAPGALEDLQWQLTRARRLGAMAVANAAASEGLYRPDGHARTPEDRLPRIKVAV